MVPCSLIFLDIDGVLNWHQKLASGYCGIHCEKVALLNRILAAVPEAKIVVSSAWRYLILRGDMTLKGFEYLLLAHGVECHDRIHGHTVADGEIAAEPNHFDVEAWKVVGLKMRAEQIRRYMAGMPEGTPFVVIDDLPLVVDRLVQTDGLVGLTAEKADEVVAVLNTRNGVPPASVPQDATEGVKTTARVWQSQVGMQRLFDSGVLFFRGSPDAEWAVSLHTLPEVRREMASWRELHGPALAAALSPSVKEYPDV